MQRRRIYKDTTLEKNKSEKINEIEENIKMFQELLEEPDIDSDLKKEYEDVIKEYNKEKDLLVKSGGAKKLPAWAKKATFELDYDLLSEKIIEFFDRHINYILSLISKLSPFAV